MCDTKDDKEVKPQSVKQETPQKVDKTPPPRELTPEEIEAVAGGPWIVNN